MNKYIKEILSFAIIIVAVLLIKRFVVMPVKVNGDSMKDTLVNNDILILNRLYGPIFKIKRFDVVVVDSKSSYIIKRVIGLPNDKLEMIENKLYINGEFIEQPFLKEDSITNDFSVTVPKDSYFVMGDNRDVSYDSREIGSIHKKNIMGKTSFIIYPFNHIGRKI